MINTYIYGIMNKCHVMYENLPDENKYTKYECYINQENKLKYFKTTTDLKLRSNESKHIKVSKTIPVMFHYFIIKMYF